MAKKGIVSGPKRVKFCVTIRRLTLANTPSAKKRARQAVTRREHNVGLRSKFRTYLKKVIAAIKDNDKTKAKEAFDAAIPVIDNMAGKGIIHKNKAARHKNRLNAQIKALKG